MCHELTCRHILVCLVISGSMVQYILRTNISIAIVDMIALNTTNVTDSSRYNWTEDQKNNILGYFFLGYALTSSISGRLSEIYGTRIVMGLGVLQAGVLTLLVPISAHLSYYLLLAVRIGVGLALGLAWSSIMPLAIRWFSPNERSKFLAHVVACLLGSALTLAVGGYLIDVLGWPSVFYVTGGVTILWSVCWFYLVFDSPSQHPRIGRDEREKIESLVTFQKPLDHTRTPWFQILTSAPVWAVCVAKICFLLNLHFATNYIPSYMKQILLLDIKENGLLSSLPYLGAYATAIFASHLSDRWMKNSTFSLLTNRRIFATLTFVIPILSLLIQTFWGYDRLISVLVIVLWQSAGGFETPSFTANLVDISPSYSGSIYGIANAFGGLVGYFSTSLFGLLIHQENDFQQWSHVFWALIIANVFGLLFYWIFGSSDLQRWDPTYRESTEEY